VCADWPVNLDHGRGHDDVDLARMRLEYETAGLDVADLVDDPIEQFDRWMADAVRGGLFEPNAMVIATVDADGQPWTRHVLLKGAGAAGFDFYTNYQSDKSRQLDANPRASVTFGWLELHRQVNVAGSVERVSAEESDAYWTVRVRGSQLGAWSSDQSRELPDREALLRRYEEVETRFPDRIPRPGHWGGWRLVPHTIEFWQGRLNRLHDRLRYVRRPDGSWGLVRLSP
jgi:pyridoxamine 5'-phosphate oxidase